MLHHETPFGAALSIRVCRFLSVEMLHHETPFGAPLPVRVYRFLSVERWPLCYIMRLHLELPYQWEFAGSFL